ncbi:MAG TPA: hypothetical protein PLI51_11495, partial [bacterium]|nr:hypothetical protein [bacterium]
MKGGEADRCARALRLLSRGGWEEAAGIFREILARDPVAAGAHAGLGLILFHQADWRGARFHLKRAPDAAFPPGDRRAMLAIAGLHSSRLRGSAGLPAALLRSRRLARAADYAAAAELLALLDAREAAARRDLLLILDIVRPESDLGAFIRGRLEKGAGAGGSREGQGRAASGRSS